MENLVIVTPEGNFTTTEIIAEGSQTEHKGIIQLVKKYLKDMEEFGRVEFKMSTFETNGGKQKRTIAVLNEQQATLLMTCLRNNEIVRTFKKNLVKAFYLLANQAKNISATLEQTSDPRKEVLAALKFQTEMAINFRKLARAKFPRDFKAQDEDFNKNYSRAFGRENREPEKIEKSFYNNNMAEPASAHEEALNFETLKAILTVHEVAAKLNCHPQTVRELIKAGRLKVYGGVNAQRGRHVYKIDHDSFIRFLKGE